MSLPESLGMLLAVLGLVFAFETPRRWIVRLLGLNNKKTDEPNTSKVISPAAHLSSAKALGSFTVTERSEFSPITVEQIINAINNAPPFQREELSNKYNGIRVCWQGYLREARISFQDKESVTVNLSVAQDKIIGCSFWFSEKLAKFPDVQTLPRGSKLEVVGTITSASGPGISVTLDPSSIQVLSTAHATQ